MCMGFPLFILKHPRRHLFPTWAKFDNWQFGNFHYLLNKLEHSITMRCFSYYWKWKWTKRIIILPHNLIIKLIWSLLKVSYICILIFYEQDYCWNILIQCECECEYGFLSQEIFTIRWTSPLNFSSRCLDFKRSRLLKKYFIVFISSSAHPPFASYNHVLAKHSWSTGGLLHRSVNRP